MKILNQWTDTGHGGSTKAIQHLKFLFWDTHPVSAGPAPKSLLTTFGLHILERK